jgi:hypothetical protein
VAEVHVGETQVLDLTHLLEESEVVEVVAAVSRLTTPGTGGEAKRPASGDG